MEGTVQKPRSLNATGSTFKEKEVEGKAFKLRMSLHLLNSTAQGFSTDTWLLYLQ